MNKQDWPWWLGWTGPNSALGCILPNLASTAAPHVGVFVGTVGRVTAYPVPGYQQSRFAAPRISKVKQSMPRFHPCSWASVMQMCSGPWCKPTSKGSILEPIRVGLAMLALWISGGGWSCAACAEEEQPPAAAMVAALALDQVEDLRVIHWLTLDSDFAFHFIEFDQAVAAAGRAVADVDQALEEVERSAPSATRPLRVKPTARKRPLRLRENTVSSPAAVNVVWRHCVRFGSRLVHCVPQAWCPRRSWPHGRSLVCGWPRSMWLMQNR